MGKVYPVDIKPPNNEEFSSVCEAITSLGAVLGEIDFATNALSERVYGGDGLRPEHGVPSGLALKHRVKDMKLQADDIHRRLVRLMEELGTL